MYISIHYSLTQKYVLFYPKPMLGSLDSKLQGDLAKEAPTVFHQPTALCKARTPPLPIITSYQKYTIIYYTFLRKKSIFIFYKIQAKNILFLVILTMIDFAQDLRQTTGRLGNVQSIHGIRVPQQIPGNVFVIFLEYGELLGADQCHG